MKKIEVHVLMGVNVDGNKVIIDIYENPEKARSRVAPLEFWIDHDDKMSFIEDSQIVSKELRGRYFGITVVKHELKGMDDK